MGDVCVEYQNFLVRAKKKYKQENFFSMDVINAFEKALQKELQNKAQDKGFSLTETQSKQRRLSFLVAKNRQGQEGPTEDERLTEHLTSKLISKRESEAKQSETSFMTFAKSSLDAIKTYKANIKSLPELRSGGTVDSFLKAVDTFYKSILKALEEYRKNSSKYHLLKASEGRAEIANRVTGGSVQFWIKDSYKKLSTVGTKFNIGEYNYACRRQTLKELGVADKSKLRQKLAVLNDSIIIQEISLSQ